MSGWARKILSERNIAAGGLGLGLTTRRDGLERAPYVCARREEALAEVLALGGRPVCDPAFRWLQGVEAP